MVDMFAQDHVCEPGEAQLSYGELSAAFREDLYVTDLRRPLPPIMRKRGSNHPSSNALVETRADSQLESFGRVAVIPAPKSSCPRISRTATPSVGVTEERQCVCTRP
jgi:hypothetical protein